MNSEERLNFLQSYFAAWKRFVKGKREKRENVQRKIEQKEKLDNLIKAMKKVQNLEKEKTETTQKSCPVTCWNSLFKNRFKAQKNTIENLTLKIIEKDRLIEELKLGILDTEALNSLNKTKYEIREIFANCSAKTRCKVAPPQDYSEKFMISTQKAPKILQELEEKALERAKRREIILERKRELEEERKKLFAEALERKRAQDENEKKKNLETIKERRRKELEKAKTRQANKAIYLEKMKKAEELHNQQIVRRTAKKLLDNYRESKKKEDFATEYHKACLLKRAFACWKKFNDEKYRDKNAVADATYSKNVLTRVVTIWKEVRHGFHGNHITNHSF